MRLIAAIVTVVSAAIATPAVAEPLPASEVRAVIASISRQLDERYPLPDISAQWIKMLRSREKAGAYARLEPDALANAIHRDLQASHRDLHLRVRHQPDVFARLSERGPRPESGARVPPSLHGVAEVRMDGDTSTLYIRNKGGWQPDSATFDSFAGAMAIGQSARNVVVDLRNCPGGSGAIGRFLAAYFFPVGESKFYLDGFHRDGHRMQEWTADKVPGPTLPDARLYVLIGKGTASACEGFAYAMQQMKRATLVGQTSAGAGIAVSARPVGHGIVISLPFKMIVGPNSDKGWEGTGIVPDVDAGDEDAVTVTSWLISQTTK